MILKMSLIRRELVSVFLEIYPKGYLHVADFVTAFSKGARQDPRPHSQ